MAESCIQEWYVLILSADGYFLTSPEKGKEARSGAFELCTPETESWYLYRHQYDAKIPRLSYYRYLEI